jgi:hypothetical protein
MVQLGAERAFQDDEAWKDRDATVEQANLRISEHLKSVANHAHQITDPCSALAVSNMDSRCLRDTVPRRL